MNTALEGEEEDRQLGLRMLISTLAVMTLRADRGAASSSTVSAPLSFQVAQAI
jgi:hypothetical protein